MKLMNGGLRQFTEKQRLLPRVCLTSEQVLVHDLGAYFSVHDISVGGCGIWLPEKSDQRYFEDRMHMVLDVSLQIFRQHVPTELTVRHVSPNVVGCSFHSLPGEIASKIGLFITGSSDVETLMRPMPQVDGTLGTPFLFVQSSGLSAWYTGSLGVSVFATATALSFQMATMFVEYDENGFVTGTMESHASSPHQMVGVVRYVPLYVQRDAEPDLDKVRVAKGRILSSTLPESLKNMILEG